MKNSCENWVKFRDCYIKKDTTMATLDDKLMGEKLHYYCSSSEDEEEENPAQG